MAVRKRKRNKRAESSVLHEHLALDAPFETAGENG
jgi:hypothetical protein